MVVTETRRLGIIRPVLIAGLVWACAATSPLYAQVTVETRRAPTGSVLIAHNDLMIDVLLKVELLDVLNVSADRSWPVTIVVPKKREVSLGTIRPGDPRRGWSFRTRYTWSMGSPSARHDARATYRLPFQSGMAFLITQAPGGPVTTHDNAHSRHAVDIAMPQGTTIVAARSGYVIGNIRHNGEGKQDDKFFGKANVVRIAHDDGTWAEYAHLLNYTANIYPGQHIAAGTPIGLSGNSGYSSGPHLHFSVQRNGGTGDVSVPFKFYNDQLGAFEPNYRTMVSADYGSAREQAKSPTTTRTRTLRECIGPAKELNNEVLSCMAGR